MRLTAVQLDIAWEDRAANVDRVQKLLDASPPGAGGLLVLPEMFATGFSMNVDVVREPVPSGVESALCALARKYDVAVVGGVVGASDRGGIRNEAVAFAPHGAALARYAKQQPFTPAGERERFQAGDRSVVFEWGGIKVAPFVCYDLRFPELFRDAVDLGAELLVVIANWPSKRVSHWETLLRARAIENQAFVLGVNRCGNDPQFQYPGRTIVVDPQGEILADAGSKEGVLHADIDRSILLSWREQFPALKDRQRRASCS